ncbi:MAG: methylated-DNA--[protein]-cysteine S-methyltransferase [Succinivibrio sp.]
MLFFKQGYYTGNSSRLILIADESALNFCFFDSSLDPQSVLKKKFTKAYESAADRTNSVLLQAVEQLDEYFSGKRAVFTVPTRILGTEFELSVLNRVQCIPYAHTVSYQEIARSLNRDNAQRAVGRAVAANPLLIFIPCHRVVRSDGKINGYSGGDDNKRYLLSLEKKSCNHGDCS